jgi:hypothetical protein
MAEGRGRQAWAHTSAILTLIANVNRDPKKTRPFKPSDFDPYSARDKHGEAIELKDMSLLRDAFSKSTEQKE